MCHVCWRKTQLITNQYKYYNEIHIYKIKCYDTLMEKTWPFSIYTWWFVPYLYVRIQHFSLSFKSMNYEISDFGQTKQTIWIYHISPLKIIIL